MTLPQTAVPDPALNSATSSEAPSLSSKTPDSPRLTIKILVIFSILAVISLPLLLAFFKFGSLQHSQSVQNTLPVIAKAPEFRLINSKKEPVTHIDFLGKVWVADFIFTRCGSTCPQMTQKMRALKSSVPGLAAVSFTVDPAYDTPEILEQYILRFNLQTQDWNFLTGTREQMEAAARGFKVTGADNAVFHSTHFILIDTHGLIRGYYDALDPEAFKTLIADTDLLLNTQEK